MFDELANSLVLLAGLADVDQVKAVVSYTCGLRHGQVVKLLPAFHPIIDEGDPLWNELKLQYAWKFRNRPGAYHNGGIWPVTNGVYIAALASVGHDEEARECLAILNEANGLDGTIADIQSRFPEYLHGRTGRPEGTIPIAWSAAATAIAHQTTIGHEWLFTCHKSMRFA